MKPSLIWVRGRHLEEFLVVRFLLFEVLGDGHTGVPFLLAESEVVGVDQLVDFLFDGAGVQRDVLL